MNNKIREIADQVKWQCQDVTYGELEKFAELIVRECADVIKQEVSMMYLDGGETEEFMSGHYVASLRSRRKIKQHFGVQE